METTLPLYERSIKELYLESREIITYKVTMFVIQMKNALRGLSAPAAWQTPEKFFI